jgi:excisionase family DNA binding protein
MIPAAPSSNLVSTLRSRRAALDIRELAELLCLSAPTLYKLAGERTIPSYRFGNSLRFDGGEIAAWVQQRSSTR